MRRDRHPFGKIALAAKVLVAALVAMTALAVRPAEAQIEAQPSWAVLLFANNGDAKTPMGKMAQDAIIEELRKLGKVDPVPAETTARQAADLGYQQPLTRPAEIQRLGNELKAVTAITGEVVNYRIVNQGDSRQAQVILRVVVWDVASGLTVNGAALLASSETKGGDVSDADLLKNALAQGAFQAMGEIASRTLPSATVLNTVNNRALINRGGRAGFTKDQRVIVIRGKSQVAEGIVRDVDPDSSFVEVTRSYRGIQPGDKIRVVFDVPVVRGEFGKDGKPIVKRSKSGGSNSGLVSLLLVLAVLAFLLSNGRGSNQDAVGNVLAEATVLPNDVPAVRISWTRDAFFRGNQFGPYQYQVWRDGAGTVPVAIASANQSFVYNDRDNSYGGTWYDFAGVVGGNTCDNEAPPEGTDPAGLGSIAGVPYRYSVEVIYRVSCFDLPDTSNCSNGGTNNTGGNTTGGNTTGGNTTGGNTTGGNTTGGNTTGGNTTGGTFCYFASPKVPSEGIATPLVRSSLRFPDDGAVVNAPLLFSFTSVRGIVTSVPIQYVVQFSDRQDFAANRTFTTDPFVELVLAGGQTVSSPTIDTSTIFPTAKTLYWRVGARNPDDNPGPVADAAGQRYIFSSKRHFQRPNIP